MRRRMRAPTLTALSLTSLQRRQSGLLLLKERKNGVFMLAVGAFGVRGIVQNGTPWSTVLLAMLVLFPERFAYGCVYHYTPRFQALCRKYNAEALHVMHSIVGAFKIVQIGYIAYRHLGLLDYSPQQLVVQLDAGRLAAGFVLLFGGFFLNFMVYYRLGPLGVHYGAQLGFKVPWCTDFPFNMIAHAQYTGMIMAVCGASICSSPSWDVKHPWFLVMWVEWLAYGMSCAFLEEGSPLCSLEAWKGWGEDSPRGGGTYMTGKEKKAVE